MIIASFVIVQHVLILRCMYIMCTYSPSYVPSDVIRKRRARVAWLLQTSKLQTSKFHDCPHKGFAQTEKINMHENK